MNKEEFITQLKESISILDDQEQQYFVEEYTQHIEMKMSQGMSEEEAVKEMGPLEELSKEILESYHVKINALEDRKVKNQDYKKFFAKIKSQVDKIYGKIAAGCKKAGAGIKKCCIALRDICLKPFKKKKAGEETEVAAGEESLPACEETAVPASGTKESQGGFLHGTARLVKRCCKGIGAMIKGCFRGAAWLAGKCFYLALWCMLFLWNAFCIGAGLIGIFFMAVFVFLVGLFLVMLTQGYPTAGFTLCALGAFVSAGGVVAACFILTRWKITRDEKPEGGEVNV